MYRDVKKRASLSVVFGFILASFILLISASIYRSFPRDRGRENFIDAPTGLTESSDEL